MRLFRSAFLSKSLKNEHVKNKQLGSVVNLKSQADFTVAVLQSLTMTKTVFSETFVLSSLKSSVSVSIFI